MRYSFPSFYNRRHYLNSPGSTDSSPENRKQVLIALSPNHMTSLILFTILFEDVFWRVHRGYIQNLLVIVSSIPRFHQTHVLKVNVQVVQSRPLPIFLAYPLPLVFLLIWFWRFFLVFFKIFCQIPCVNGYHAVCVFLSGPFHLASFSQDPYMLSQMARFPSFPLVK